MEYQPATLATVRGYLAKPLISGLDIEDDKSEIDDVVDSYRNFLYNQYHRINLFDEYMACLEITCFPLDCSNPCKCDDFYWGFVLPEDMAGVESAWYQNAPLNQRSRWYEGKEKMISEGYRDMGNVNGGSFVPVSGSFALPKPLKKCALVNIVNESRKDNGKEFIIDGKVDIGGDDPCNKETEDFHLSSKLDDVVSTCVPLVDITNISMPSNLTGAVRIEDLDGNLITKISPKNPMPRYRRYKVDIGCECNSSCGCMGHIAVKGKRKFTSLFFDSDIVEIGDRRIVEHFGVMHRYEYSKDTEEQNLSTRSRGKLLDELEGIVSRYRSEEIEDRVSQYKRHKANGTRIIKRRRRR